MSRRTPTSAAASRYRGRHRRPRQAPASLQRTGRGVAAGTLGLGLVLGALPAAAPAAAHPREATTASVSADRPLLRYGVRGPEVRWLQKRLDVRPASGWFGPITRAAVKRYQRTHGIRPTGTVGPATWASLLGSQPAKRSHPTPSHPTPSRPAPSRVAQLDWRALAQCESSNNLRAVNPSGYYGLYQFDVRTWRGVGGNGYPHQASRSEQTFRAQRLYLARGSSPWPTCGRLLYG